MFALKTCKAIGCSSVAREGDFCHDCTAEIAEASNDPFVTQPFTPSALKLNELDPNGKSPHEAGAKVDAGKVRMHLITGGMARAIEAVAKIATFGAKKYTDGGWVTVPDGFNRYEDAQQRHATYRHKGETVDPDSNYPHLYHEAWNALAKLDLYIREQEQLIQ